MIKKRSSIFETNSSSTHSVAITKKENLEKSYLIPEEDGYIHTRFEEYGWEVTSYHSQEEKLSYIVTMIAEINGIKTNWFDNTEEFELTRTSLCDNCQDWINLDNEVYSYTGYHLYLDDSDGYIDHQSHEDYRSMNDYFHDWGIDSYTQFIFDTAITVYTDNDNH